MTVQFNDYPESPDLQFSCQTQLIVSFEFILGLLSHCSTVCIYQEGSTAAEKEHYKCPGKHKVLTLQLSKPEQRASSLTALEQNHSASAGCKLELVTLKTVMKELRRTQSSYKRDRVIL